MKNFSWLLLFLITTVSCEKKKQKECISSKIDVKFLENYLIRSDSCKTYKEYDFSRYYDEDRLLMSGYSERTDKQGEWVFFKDGNNEFTKGFFENSQPEGKWVLKNIGKVEWKVYQNLEKGYFFSYPSEWKIIESNENNSLVVFDNNTSSDFSNYTLKFIITCIKLEDLEESIESLYEGSIANLKKENMKNLKHKEIDIEDSGSDKYYEINYEELNNNVEYFSSELMFSYNDNLYLKSFSIKKSSEYDYKVLKEILETSFKVFKD